MVVFGGSSGGPRQRLRVGALGQLGDQAGVGHGDLGIAATVHDGQGGDGLPDPQTGIGDAIADAAEVAGNLDAGNERQRDVDDTATVEDLSVVGTGEGDVDGHLTRTGHGSGHVGEGQDVGIAEAGDRDGTHGQRAFPLDQDASSPARLGSGRDPVLKKLPCRSPSPPGWVVRAANSVGVAPVNWWKSRMRWAWSA